MKYLRALIDYCRKPPAPEPKATPEQAANVLQAVIQMKLREAGALVIEPRTAPPVRADREHVILLTDGQRTTGPDTMEAARMAAERGVRIFTGTIPDYSTEVKGLLLSGVIGGGPAEQAGLAKGDVIAPSR